ncbi:MAG: hypothetical protein ACOYEQ_08865 [Bacillota bacterium]|jgi:hypothetical protein
MVDKNLLKAALEVADRPIDGRCNPNGECCCPGKVVYVIFTNCLTINNGACPDWEFCDQNCPTGNAREDLACKG